MSLFEQTISFNPNEFDISKYMDLNIIKTITYEELVEDVSKFKLSGIPLLDMISVKKLGTFLDNKFCYDKWQICPDIILEIFTVLNQKLPDCNIQYNDIEKYINKLRKDNADVQSIDVKMEIYMTDFLRSIYWDKNSIKQNNQENIDIYFASKKIIYEIMKEIKLQYEYKWNEIDQQFKSIQDLLSTTFEDIEDDPKYIVAACLLEKINNDANKFIDPIRSIFAEQIKSEYQKYVNLKSISKLNDFQIFFNELKNKFSDEIEKVYQQVFIDNIKDKTIHKHILEFFVIEKSMHQFNLSLDLTELLLSQLK
jgi:hypothetical protein